MRRNGVSMDIRELRTEHIEFSGETMDRVLRSAILNSNVIDVIQDNKRPFDELMSKYRCAIMEIETKFKVLNEQFSLQYDRNPIETIKTRLKSMESVLSAISLYVFTISAFLAGVFTARCNSPPAKSPAVIFTS